MIDGALRDELETMRLLISCPDGPGIVAAVSRFLFEQGANIVRLDQYSADPDGGEFFMRVEFDIPRGRRSGLVGGFPQAVGERFEMTWRLWPADQRKRLAILVSKHDHCLSDLLWRWQRRELDGEIVMVISNHASLREEVERFGLPYHHVPVTKARKPAAEAEILDLLEGRCELVVLARYMQILSADFLARVNAPVINIHHSFLPAFAGAAPYEQAKQRGVKLIGATAHYATEELDGGPIIEQDVARVSHSDSVAALMQRGADIERTVLWRAVQAHCQDRVLRHGNTTIVF
jgi:formyltetrahydrofolate deformylase